jgi:putative ABC transport system permease protein
MMSRRVPLARKNLFQDRRRALLAILGVAASMVLVLVLDGVFAGSMRQVTSYMRNSPADVFVSQRDVRTMHMSQSAIPAETVDAVLAVDGVAWAEPLHYTTDLLEAGNEARLSYVLGYDVATGRGGPQELADGQPPGPGDALVDEVVAGEIGIAIGDTMTILGESFRVSGLSTDGTNIVNTTTYITAADFARLRGDDIAYVLVGAGPGVSADQLTGRLDTGLPNLTVQTSAEFASEERSLVSDMAADIMQIMTIIGFLIALAVVGLTLFTATLGKLREYGVVKALGASPSRLAATVLTQAVWSVAIGLVVAIAIAFALGAAVTALTPNVQVAIEPGAIARAATGALLVGGLAALMPLRRVLRVDPATAFRRA